MALSAPLVRKTLAPEIFIAFQEERDARTLGDALQAGAPEGPGWITRRAVELDGAAIAAMAAALPAPRERLKDPSANRPKVAWLGDGAAPDGAFDDQRPAAAVP